MNIEETIKELEDALADKWCHWSQKTKDSIRLGIEALKRVDKYRPLYAGKYPHLLPGETKE